MRARRGEQQSEVGSGAARHRKTNRERKQDRDEEDRRAAAHIPYTYGQTGPSSPAYPVGVKPALTLVLGGLIAACALGVGAFLALRGGEPAPRAERPARTAPEPAARPTRNLAARVPAGDTIALRDRPGGRVLARVGARTEFGSPQTLAVAIERGDWVALRRPISLEVDLSRRELAVRDAEGVERRISIAIGAPDTPTPPGEFYITDKLPGARFGPYYGCCILALSGRQPNLPEGWSGGDRLAVHGSPTTPWGHAVSNGCLHAAENDLRYLMKTVPLGTQVSVHS